MTYTYVTMDVSADTYDEIRQKLIAAGYHQALHEQEGRPGFPALDMHGIALTCEEHPTPFPGLDMHSVWIAYGRGYRRCLELILSLPTVRILISLVGIGGDAPELTPQVRDLLRTALITSAPEGAAEGFDSVDKTSAPAAQ